MKAACHLLAGLFAGLLTCGDAFGEDDPDGKQNLASEGKLPSGDRGLAAAHPGDKAISSHPAVIFSDDFEAENELNLSRWDEYTAREKRVLSLGDPSDPNGRLGRQCLRVEATLSRNTGGGATKWFESAETLFIRFYVRFAPECDYVHHFCTLRANRGLRGGDRWSGFGQAGLRPEGDERFSTALEPWGDWGKLPPPGKWNFYSYWHEMAASPDGKFWGNAFRPATQEAIPKGTWICCEFMLQHNTPGQPDGEQAFWIDGRLLGHWTGINWRKIPGLTANAFTLESYVTDRWTRQETNIVSFDNVVIAREYIGPTPPLPSP